MISRRACRLIGLWAVAVFLLSSSSFGPQARVGAAGPPTNAPLQPPVASKTTARLDGPLGQIVARVGTRSARDLAATAPLSRGETVAVTARLVGRQAVAGVRAYLVAHGATVANVGSDVIEAYVPVPEIAALAALPEVRSVEAIVPPGGDLVTSQGTTLHNSPNWNAAGYTGSGIKVGIIDQGFGGHSGLIAAGEVPTPAGVHCYTAIGVFTANLSDCETSEVHGTGCVETILDIAPAVTVYLATSKSNLDVRNDIAWMASQGVTVISYSISALEYIGPGDGTSPLTNTNYDFVNDAVSAGIVWLSAAGNDGQSSWYGPYSGSLGGYINFGTSNINTFSATAGKVLNVRARWEDSWTAAARDFDLDLYYFNGSGYTRVASSAATQDGTAGRTPREFIQYTVPTTGTYAVALYHHAGTAPAWLQVQVFNGPPFANQITTASIGQPGDSANPGMLAVGAAKYSTPARIELYSNRGPTTDNRVKPDITGADCGNTNSYPTGFCGTSQATPHLAGLAALVRQRFPAYTPAQVTSYLKTAAIPRGTQPNNDFGAGFAAAPQNVTAITPNSGLASGGFPIQISGVGIGATTTVTVAGNACTGVASLNGTTIRCILPAGPGGSVNVTLLTNGQTLTVPSGFTYQAPNALPGAKPAPSPISGGAPLPIPQPSGGTPRSPAPLPPRR